MNISVNVFSISDINADYLRWVNESDFIQTVKGQYTPEIAESYITAMAQSVSDLFMAVTVKDVLVGTYHLSHTSGDSAWCGVMIGKEHRNKGYATEATRMVTRRLFPHLKVFNAGVRYANTASLVSFTNADFVKVDDNGKSHILQYTAEISPLYLRRLNILNEPPWCEVVDA